MLVLIKKILVDAREELVMLSCLIRDVSVAPRVWWWSTHRTILRLHVIHFEALQILSVRATRICLRLHFWWKAWLNVCNIVLIYGFHNYTYCIKTFYPILCIYLSFSHYVFVIRSQSRWIQWTNYLPYIIWSVCCFHFTN